MSTNECKTCHGLGRVDAVYAPCPDCEPANDSRSSACSPNKEDCWDALGMALRQRDIAMTALKRIAGEDYRGNRPQSAYVAEKALREIQENNDMIEASERSEDCFQ